MPDEMSCRAQRIASTGFVIGCGRAHGEDFRCARLRPHDVDYLAIKPLRYRPRPRDPSDRNTRGKQSEAEAAKQGKVP